MSSVDNERVVGKKRENPGSLSGRMVFESKKEKKKRRLILSDSESDDDNSVISPLGKALALDSVDELKGETKSDLGSEVAKECERAKSDQKDFVDSAVQDNGVDHLQKEKRSTDGSTSIGEIKVPPESVLSSEVFDTREKGSFCESTNKDEIKAESNKASISEGVEQKEVDDHGKIVNALPINDKEIMDQITCKDGSKVGSEVVPKLDVVKKQVDAVRTQKMADISGASRNGGSFVRRKNMPDRLSSKEETKTDAKMGLKSKFVKEREGSDTKNSFTRVDQNKSSFMTKKNKKAFVHSEVQDKGVDYLQKEKRSLDVSTSIEEIKVPSESVLSLEVADTREKSSFCESTNKDEIKAESNKDSISERVEQKEEDDHGKIVNALPINDMESMDQISCMDGSKVGSEMDPKLEVVKKQVDAVRTQKMTDISGAARNGGSFVRRKNSPDRLSSKEETKTDSKMGLKSKFVKETEGADTKNSFARVDHNKSSVMTKKNKKAFVDSEVQDKGVDNPQKEKHSIDGLTSIGEIKVHSEGVVSSEVADIREKGSICESTNKDETKAESNTASILEGVEQKEEDAPGKIVNTLTINDKESMDQITCKDENKVGSEMVTKREAVKKQVDVVRTQKMADISGASQNGGSFVRRKNSPDRLSSKEETKTDAKIGLKSKFVKEREGADTKNSLVRVDQNKSSFMTKKKNGTDQFCTKEEMVKAKTGLKAKVIKESEEAGSNKNSIFSQSDQRGGGSSSRKLFSSDQLANAENRKAEAKRNLKSQVVKRGDIISIKKKALESGVEKKRSRDTLDDAINLKKVRSEHVKCRQDQNKETSEKNMKRKYLKSGVKGCEIESSLGSNSAASGIRQRDESNEKRTHEILAKNNKREPENDMWIERSTARTLRKLKDNCPSSGSARRNDVDISQQKGSRMHGEGGVMRVLPSNKKVGGIEAGHILPEEKENKKNTAKHHVISKETKTEKPISTGKSMKDQLSMVNVSSAVSATPSKSKAEAGTSSLKVKPKKVDILNAKTNPIAKGEPLSKSEAPVMFTLNSEDKASERRSTVKQRVRDQIREILLNAGWKIDLRPRRGRAYEDAVYIPPTGGSGLWSITKAYAAYVKSNKSEDSSKKYTGDDQEHEGTSHKYATVPDDILSLLTRNVVNKRRSRKEMEKSKKLGVMKKAKGGHKTKCSNKHELKILRKDDGGKVRKKRKNYVESTGSAAHKLHLRVRNKKQRGCALLVRGANQDTDNEVGDDYVPYAWKRTLLSWLIDLGVLCLDEKVKYMNSKQTRALLEGSITRDGIRCGCCSKIISIAKFEIHAGSKLHQPYENIFVEETGFSLLQCQLNAWEKQGESERQTFYRVDIEGDDPNDDTCGLCGDGGDLICCDGCPSTFHLNCLGIQMLPPGDWHCTNCSCRYCGLVSDYVPEENRSSTSTLLTCSQCEKKYHRECTPEADAIPVSSNDSDASFCGKSCKKVFKRLQKLLGAKNDLESGLSWSLVRRFGEDSSGQPCRLPGEVECNSKIAVAFAVMDECFRPIVDHRSGINLIHNVVYNCGSNIKRLSYTGFYTFILERGDEIVAVASVRIHGTKMAEMPFIGTRNMYRRQGMCRQLLKGIESALCALNVEKLIIPAISELTETWTNVFGFKPLDHSQRYEVSSVNMLVFPGTGLLHKPILIKGHTEEHMNSNGGKLCEFITKHEHICEAANTYSVLSSGQPKASSSTEEGVPKIEAEVAELVFQTNENSDAPTKYEFQTLQHKSPEIDIDVELSGRSKVDNNILMGNDTITLNSSDKPKEEKPSDVIVHGTKEVCKVTSVVALNNFAVDVTTVGHDTIIEHQHLIGAESRERPSSARSELHGDDDVVVQPTDEHESVTCIEHTREDACQISSSSEPKKVQSCEVIMHDGHEMKDVLVTSNLCDVDASARYGITAEYTTQEATMANSTCNLLANGDNSLPHNCVVQDKSMGINSSTQQVCDDRSSFDATHLHGSESTSTSSSSVADHIGDGNHDRGNKSDAYQRTLKPLGDSLRFHGSDIIAAHVDSVQCKTSASSVEANVYESGASGAADFHDTEAETDRGKYEADAVDMDTEACTSKVNDKPFDISCANGEGGNSNL